MTILFHEAGEGWSLIDYTLDAMGHHNYGAVIIGILGMTMMVYAVYWVFKSKPKITEKE